MLENIFRDEKDIRVASFLLAHNPLDYPITELATNTRLPRSTIYGILEHLRRYGVVSETRKINKMNFYAIAETEGIRCLQRFVIEHLQIFQSSIEKYEEMVSRNQETMENRSPQAPKDVDK